MLQLMRASHAATYGGASSDPSFYKDHYWRFGNGVDDRLAAPDLKLTDEEQTAFEDIRSASPDMDEDVARLRAMRATRGDDEVRRLAWQLRAYRDKTLANQLADREGGAAYHYYAPTTREDVVAGFGAKAARAAEASRLGEPRPGRDYVSAADRRRAKYIAARFGLEFRPKYEWSPEGSTPVRAKDGGWHDYPGPSRMRQFSTGGREFRRDDAIDGLTPDMIERPERYVDRIIAWYTGADRDTTGDVSGAPKYKKGDIVAYSAGRWRPDSTGRFSVGLSPEDMSELRYKHDLPSSPDKERLRTKLDFARWIVAKGRKRHLAVDWR